ncbi:MAG: hypothetical protein ABSA29_00625 [Terriglobales bacterium]|jgi:hypothetical protein
MGHQKSTARLLKISALVSIVMAFTTLLSGQEYTPGQPVIANSTKGTVTDGVSWDAKAFPGSDICAQIFNAWSAAMATGLTSATIDARGITGTQSCSANPFPRKASGKLWLGNTVIITTATWQVPSKTHVEGLGVATLTDKSNTTLRAGSSAADPVLQMGNNQSVTFDVQVKSMTVDAYGLATTGILNNSALEGSTLEDVDINNATKYGLLLGQYSTARSAAGSGPYRNINIQFNKNCSTCGTGTIGVMMLSNLRELGFPIRGLDNVTVSGIGAKNSTIGTCIAVIGYSVLITNTHEEFCQTGIQIGAEGGLITNGVEVMSAAVDPFNGWNITITNASDILLSGIEGFGKQLLQDNVTGNQIMGEYKAIGPIGFYLLGDGPHPAVISTTAQQSQGALKWIAPGDLDVIGNLSKTTGTFKIDDPMDPGNKYLYHSFVESPDMMDVYNGSVMTDKHGKAVVTLPDYFEKLNRDFRYQLTAIGTFAQATVINEIENNQFTIRTSKPGVKVSWQVTGIRQDAYAKAHPLKVEEEKPAGEQGRYLHPEVMDSSRIGAEPAADK